MHIVVFVLHFFLELTFCLIDADPQISQIVILSPVPLFLQSTFMARIVDIFDGELLVLTKIPFFFLLLFFF